jgi:N-acetylglucosamine-6-phosphate deacetylase
VRPPDLELLQRLYQWSERSIRLVTLAAELPGAETLVRWAAGQGMVVSIGHTLASAEDLRRLTKAGALALTHLGNGLPHLLHKFSNPLMAGLADERYTAMLIGDGHHIPAGVLKVMLRAKGVPQSIIVSDAAPVAGLPPGGYFTLGNEAVLEESGRLYNPAKGVLVGSSATLLKCMNHLASLDFLTLEDLLDLGFYNPLHLLGLDPAQLPSIESRLSFDEERHQFMIS